MAIPAKPQTFGLEDCHDMLAKLEWELARFREALSNDVDALRFTAFNTAVTAWQIAEWIWPDLRPDQQRAIWDGLSAAQRTALKDRMNYGALQAKARTECRAVYICRQIATASKHSAVTTFFDPNIVTATSAPGDTAADGTPNFIVAGAWALKVIDGGETMLALTVFDSALAYWTKFIQEHRVAAHESEPIPDKRD